MPSILKSTIFSESIKRDISPPEATLDISHNSAFLLAENIKLTSSIPVPDGVPLAFKSTRKRELGMPSCSSSVFTRSSMAGNTSFRCSDNCSASFFHFRFGNISLFFQFFQFPNHTNRYRKFSHPATHEWRLIQPPFLPGAFAEGYISGPIAHSKAQYVPGRNRYFRAARSASSAISFNSR